MLHTIVSFDSISDAFSFADEARAAGIEGRLRTVPRQISAGCGTAWDSPSGWHERISRLITEKHLDYDAIHKL